MGSSFQDDTREKAMRDLFHLYKDDSEGRSGIDAYLDFNGIKVPFELKTTSKGSVTTVRDFGHEHILKWKDKHWLIGFFIQGEEYYKYGSPAMMSNWISSKEKYIHPDFQLATIAPRHLNHYDLLTILGDKECYTLEDAQSIHKKQYTKSQYIDAQDLEGGYSKQRMLEILKDRAKYLIERGSTLNNPHIPFSYFKGWPKIKDNHSAQLRLMVAEYFKSSQRNLS